MLAVAAFQFQHLVNFANGMGKDGYYNYKIENHVQSVVDCCTTQARYVRQRPVLLASELVRYASSIDSTRIAKIMAQDHGRRRLHGQSLSANPCHCNGDL